LALEELLARKADPIIVCDEDDEDIDREKFKTVRIPVTDRNLQGRRRDVLIIAINVIKY
jgi:hypothetical protein